MACYGHAMANLQVKNVPPELYEELRRRAAQRHVTIRDYVLALIVDDQRRPTADDWLESLRSRGPLADLAGVDVAAIVRAGRDERDTEILGRLQQPDDPHGER